MIILAIIILAAFVVGYFLSRAPVGYEDETGFHYGKPIELRKRGMGKE